MIGLGTFINCGMILAGGILGLLFGSFLSEKIRKGLNDACGLAVMFLGISGAVSAMLTVEDGTFSTRGALMLTSSLCIGVLIGETVDLEDKMEQFGNWLKQKSGNAKDPQFVNAFVTASLTVCIGAMAIVGAIRDGIYGDWSVLALKGVLDLVIVMIMTAGLGKGALFSAIPVFLLQFGVTMLAHVLSGFMRAEAVSDLSIVGNILIFAVGVNLLKPHTFRVANLLPAVLVAVIWAFF